MVFNPFGFGGPVVSPLAPPQPVAQGSRFVRRALVVSGRDVLGPAGEVVNAGRTPGVTVYHWMDGDLAAGWFAEAGRRLAAGGDVLAALMAGYNALNIPWIVDPEARRLWRAHVAGRPAAYGGTTGIAEFGAAFDYNPAWFVPTSVTPGFSEGGDASVRTGDLAAATPELVGRDPIGNVPTAFPWLRVPPALKAGSRNETERDPAYAAVIENYYAGGGFPDARQGDPETHFVPAPEEHARDIDHPAGPDLPRGTRGDRVYTFTTGYFNFVEGAVGKRVAPAPAFYAPWLAAWVAAVARRTPEDVVLAARAYTTYLNNTAASLNGGAPAYLAAVANVPAEVLRDETTGPQQAGLRVAAAGAAAVGGAFAGVTFGISALIGGAAALVLTSASALVRGNPDQIHRDEFGRFKPVLERGWLAGNPGDPTDLGRPPLDVPAPPGWTRPHPIFGGMPIFPQAPSRSDASGLAPPAAPLSTAARVGLVLAGLAAVGAIVYAGTRTRPPRVRTRSTPR